MVVAHDVIARQGAESFGRPDPPPAHAVLIECDRVQFFRRDRRWIIQLAIVFLQDNLDFALELAGVESGFPQRIRLNIAAARCFSRASKLPSIPGDALCG